MTSPSANSGTISGFLQELHDYTAHLEHGGRYGGAIAWLDLWVSKVVKQIRVDFGEQIAQKFLGPPSLGSYGVRDMRSWRARIRRREALLIVLSQQEQERLEFASRTNSQPTSLPENLDELLDQLLSTWRVVSRSGKLNEVAVQDLHDKSFRALSQFLSSKELCRFEKLDPSKFENQLLDGFNLREFSSFSLLSECAKGWSLQLNLLKLGLDEDRNKIVKVPYASSVEEFVGNKNVFIIHGHDDNNLLKVKDMVREFGLVPVVMKDEVGDGLKTFLDKFEELAKSCCYCIALLTKDDCVTKNGVQIWQGRPNTIFEIGWFCRHFERKKILMLVQKDCDIWSDLQGVEYERFDDNVSTTYEKMHRSLKAAKILES